MKNIKVLLLLAFIYISGAALAGGDKTQNTKQTATAEKYKIKSMLTSEFASSSCIEGEYVIIYKINSESRICVSDVLGADEKMRKDISNYLSGKKVSGSESHDNKVLKVNFNVHNAWYLDSYVY